MNRCEINGRLAGLGQPAQTRIAKQLNASVRSRHGPSVVGGDGAAFQLACEAKRIDLAFRSTR